MKHSAEFSQKPDSNTWPLVNRETGLVEEVAYYRGAASEVLSVSLSEQQECKNDYAKEMTEH